MEWVWWVLGGLLVVLVIGGIVEIIDGYRKGRRILTEGTVASITRRTVIESHPGSSDPQFFHEAGTTTSVKVRMRFEFYVDGKKRTAVKAVDGKLAKKKEGDRIRVYYRPSNPGKDQMVEPW